jgi:branched-chain amino acid transport system ATP-binding protein
MSDVVLELSDLTAGYGGPAVVRGIDLNVHAGEIVALLGANGAGKSTTLRAASDLLSPMSGSITFLGKNLSHVSPPERARWGIAHVPEGRGIFYGLTVAEHFRLCHPGETMDVQLALDYFPALAKLQGRRAGLLSGGEQQMLAVGRALARKPKLLMLDELSLGLAPIIVEHILPVIRDYAVDRGCAVLLVEQHVQLALEYADVGYVMSHGEIVAHDNAAVLKQDHSLLLSSYLGEHSEEFSPTSP